MALPLAMEGLKWIPLWPNWLPNMTVFLFVEVVGVEEAGSGREERESVIVGLEITLNLVLVFKG